MITAKLTTQIYEMEEQVRFYNETYPGRRAAKIYFINGKFDRCEYSVTELKRYTLEDWIFIKGVAIEIERLSMEQAK